MVFRPLFCLFLMGCLRQVSLYHILSLSLQATDSSVLGADKKIKQEPLDIKTQPQTLSEVLASPKPPTSDQVSTSVTTSNSITSMSITTVATSSSGALDIKPEIKTEIKTEIKQEVDSTSVSVKEEIMDSTTAVTPKVEPISEMDEPKPSPMETQSSSSTPAASPAPPKPRQKKGRIKISKFYYPEHFKIAVISFFFLYNS